MTPTSPGFHFPQDVTLQTSPLVEAWLELRWQLDRDQTPGLPRDPGYAFALGSFFSLVRDRFGHREDLETSAAPVEMLPYVARHRFRPAEQEWPLLQLGPGVASVNFTAGYTWKQFLECALYLRSQLTQAYESELIGQLAALRYRNCIPVDYGSQSVLEWMNQHLNISASLPRHIPGPVGLTGIPSSARVAVTFDLAQPVGKGTVNAGTAVRPPTGGEPAIGEQIVLWDLEVVSANQDAPPLESENGLRSWLGSAHAVLHEWFLALIEGPLYRLFAEGEQ